MAAETEAAVKTDVEEKKRAEPDSKDEASSSPDAKKQKTEKGAVSPTKPVDPSVVRKQVEYYLSDENLKHDRFFHEKISTNVDGWLEMALIISCNKMKVLRAGKDDVVTALKDSKIEINEEKSAVRRPGNAPLPALEARSMHHQKKQVHAHDGGVILMFKHVPAEQSWVQVKEQVTKQLPHKKTIWHASEVNDKAQCVVVAQPFEDDLKFYENLVIEAGGAQLKAEILYGDQLQQALKAIPRYVREKRDKEARRRQKDRQRPILIGTQKFQNVGALRTKVREVLSARSEGEDLKPEGSDFKLIKALLAFHPKGEEKIKGMVGLKVDKSIQGDNRCFFLVKEGGDTDDVSMKKCIDAVEMNPPYMPIEKKEATAEVKDGAKPESDEKKTEEQKTEEKKGEDVAMESKDGAAEKEKTEEAKEKTEEAKEKTEEAKEKTEEEAKEKTEEAKAA